MADLDTFVTEYPPDADRERPRRAMLASLARSVPAELVTFWKRVGFGSFGGGLVWAVNPALLDAPLAEWLPPGKRRPRAIAVVRTAFGKVIAWHDRRFVLLDVHHGDRFDASDDVQVLFDVFLVGPSARGGILQAHWSRRPGRSSARCRATRCARSGCRSRSEAIAE